MGRHGKRDMHALLGAGRALALPLAPGNGNAALQRITAKDRQRETSHNKVDKKKNPTMTAFRHLEVS